MNYYFLFKKKEEEANKHKLETYLLVINFFTFNAGKLISFFTFRMDFAHC